MPKHQPHLAISVNPIEYRNERVITFELVDQLHERPPGTASRNFNENRHRFLEGEDFFRFSKDEIRLLGMTPRPKGLNVLTESGYLILVKSFTDDRAWQVKKALIRFISGPKKPTAISGSQYGNCGRYSKRTIRNLTP